MTVSEEGFPHTAEGNGRLVAIQDWLGRFPLSILQLGFRIGVGMVFFKAGILKYQSFEFAVKLFEDEYKVPILAPAVAARMAMINELTTSTLLFLGFATRLVTLPLFGLISVIQIFVYPTAWPDHVLWGSILLFLLTRGPGALSVDHFIETGVRRSQNAVARRLLDRFSLLRAWLERLPLSVIQLAMRIGVGLAFFGSGLSKYKSFDYATQLFTEAYKIPFLNPAIAARAAMVNELTCSILLILGLATRVATVPLIAMISVIQLVYPADWPNHVLWGSILIFLLSRGPGPFSVDRIIGRHFLKRQ